MKAFLINPTTQVIQEIDTSADYKEIRDLIGCRTAGAFYPQTDNARRLVVWIDDNGLLHENVEPLWLIDGYAQPIAGKGVLLGLTYPHGDHCSCQMSLKEVKAAVTWLPDVEFIGMHTTESEEDHPILGRLHKVTSVAKFAKKEDSTDGR